jgi:plastocyanin
MRHKTSSYALATFALLLVCPGKGTAQSLKASSQDDSIHPIQIVALDECDPESFNKDPHPSTTNPNPGLGPDFCKNIALAPLGFATTLQDLFKAAGNGTPDPNWDFEPDEVQVKKGSQIIVTNQGGEPHTFTEVKQFGGGFVPPLNNGQSTVPECNDGFKNLAVARTRILQGSQLQVGELSKGEHYFQCCIHPWMRVTVEVKDHK